MAASGGDVPRCPQDPDAGMTIVLETQIAIRPNMRRGQGSPISISTFEKWNAGLLSELIIPPVLSVIQIRINPNSLAKL